MVLRFGVCICLANAAAKARALAVASTKTWEFPLFVTVALLRLVRRRRCIPVVRLPVDLPLVLWLLELMYNIPSRVF
ncbi:hypothetical protein ACFO4N_00355 [Camelliibacillus cellulosilyticus]|uniref:Secreted protein n=1 Tax=Camelliibacillus cellulosilyticus TaxID=2174486 RepID=A0ABV9GJC0_9BACL